MIGVWSFKKQSSYEFIMGDGKSGVWPSTDSISKMLWVCDKRWQVGYGTKNKSH